MRAPGRDCVAPHVVRRSAMAIGILLITIPCVWIRAEEPSPLPPAWGCLPEHTLAVLRVPNLAAFADAFTAQTRLGAAMNDAQRWKAALKFFAKQCGGDLEDAERQLAAYDLKIDDWRALVSSEIGYAVIGDEELAATAQGKTIDPDSELHEVFVLWLEPEEELGQRLWKAWDRWTARAVADFSYLKRFDESLAGTPVVRLAAKDPPLPHGTLNFGGGFSGRGLSFYVTNDSIKKKADQPVYPVSDYHLLVARVGRRFLLVHNYPGSQYDAEQAQADSVASLELCRQVMTQLLERHARPGEPSPWLREAVAQSSREGATLFELFGNLALLLRVEITGMEQELREAKEDNKLSEYQAFDLAYWSLLKPTVAGLGNVIVRGSLQENRFERTVRVNLAAERDGFLKLFDADALPAESPAWVPATAQGYSQINLDAAAIAEPIRTLLKAVRESKEGAALALVEAQWHVNLEELIAGLGPRLMFVEFADPPEGKQRVGPGGAVLWQVRNEESWQKGFQAAAGSFGLKLLERDGYVGMQIPLFGKTPEAKKYQSAMPWLLAGHGHLLYVMGEDPTGPPLANLPEPAASGASFRDSRAFKRVAELFPGDTCFAFQCIDRSAPDETRLWLRSWISQLAKLRLIPYDAPQGKSTESLLTWSREWWSRLLGDEAQEALLTVEADRMTIEPDGIVHRAVLEFVPPER